MKILCIHPALAPYRLDFFNLLAERVDLEVAFVHRNAVNQKFDQGKLLSDAKFHYRYLKGFDVKGRNIRFGIRRLIRECRPDVVLSYEASPITMWLCLLKTLHLGTWRLWTHMDEAPDTILSRRGIRARARNWVLRHCDGVMVPSKAAAQAYRSILIHPPPPSRPAPPPSPKFIIVPIAHDTATIRKNAVAVIETGKEWRRQFAPKVWKSVLLFVGRLARVKNLQWLIEQMKGLDESIGLVLVGSGDEEDALKAKVAEYGLSNRVLFAGKKTGDDLYAIMSAADALVLPSTFEPYGAVVPEAMQWGTPCIVRDTCGSKVLVDKRNGRVFHSADDFKCAIDDVLGLAHGTESILPIDLRDSVEELAKELNEDTRNTIFA